MRIFVSCFFLFFSTSAMAQSLSEYARSTRGRAMGGVYIPFVRDAEAVFVNPAALGFAPLLDIKVIDVDIGTNTTTIDSLEAFQNIDPNESSTFDAFYGKRLWAQATGKVAVAIPFFAVGYLNNAEVAAVLHNPAFPQFETYFRQDDAIYIGSSFAIGPSSYIGASVKRINRWGGDTVELGIGDVADSSSMQDIGANFENKGQGYGLDLAAMTEIPLPILKPTLAVVWEDVGSTAFTKTAGTEAPSRLTQNLTVAAGVGVDLPGLDLLLGAEARHLLEPEMQIGKKLHLGAEVSLPLIDVRAGFNQGYFTYGAGVNILIFHLDGACYTEELGVYPGQTGDARYMVSLSIDLSFDANFKFTDNTGKRRKLKQRR